MRSQTRYRLFLVTCFCLLAPAAHATEITLHLRDGDIQAWSLAEVQRIDFTDQLGQLQIVGRGLGVSAYPLAAVEKATFSTVSAVPCQASSGFPVEHAVHAYPNPFNGTARIAYDLRRAGRVRIDIYNLLGRRVSTLVDRVQMPGEHSVYWGGTSDAGVPLASGCYLCSIRLPGQSLTTKLTLIQ